MAPGKRNKFGSLAPICLNLGLSEVNVLLKKVFWCDIVGNFRGPRGDSAPKELCPLSPTRYAPGYKSKNTIPNCSEKRIPYNSLQQMLISM